MHQQKVISYRWQVTPSSDVSLVWTWSGIRYTCILYRMHRAQLHTNIRIPYWLHWAQLHTNIRIRYWLHCTVLKSILSRDYMTVDIMIPFPWQSWWKKSIYCASTMRQRRAKHVLPAKGRCTHFKYMDEYSVHFCATRSPTVFLPGKCDPLHLCTGVAKAHVAATMSATKTIFLYTWCVFSLVPTF